MHPVLGPLVIAIALGGLALVAASVIGRTLMRRRHLDSRARLPHGADAALWSIVEAIPDPRNHLALTRDLSGEVHITDLDRATALAQAMDAIAAERADAQVIQLTDPAPRTTPDDFTTADGAEDLTLTGSLFFAGPPQLNRF